MTEPCFFCSVILPGRVSSSGDARPSWTRVLPSWAWWPSLASCC